MTDVRIIRPNSTVATTHVTVTGSADTDDALRDTSGSNYIDLTGAGASSAVVDLESLSPALAADERIVRARAIVYLKMAVDGNIHTDVSLRRSAVDVLVMQKFGSGFNAKYISSWANVDPSDSLEFTETDINALQLKFEDPITHAGRPRITYAWVEVEVQSKPQVSITSPVSGGIAKVDGVVRWILSTGDAPLRYHMKIFTHATVLAGGFDPDSSIAVYDSGEKNFTGSFTVPLADVAYDTQYFVYLRASTQFNGGPNAPEEWWGDWESANFKTESVPTTLAYEPNGTITTAQPVVRWIYNDVDGKTPLSFKVRIFDLDVNPGVTEPISSFTGMVYNSPPIDPGPANWSPGAYQWALPAPILHNLTNFRVFAYPIVAGWDPALIAEVGGIGYSDFDTSWTPPATPTMTITTDPNNARNVIRMKNNLNNATARVTVQRSADAGMTWQSVRGIVGVDINYNLDFDFYDYEVPLNEDILYRGYIWATVVGNPEQSAYVTQTVKLIVPRCWLKNIDDPTQNRHIILEDDYIQRIRAKRRAVFEPIGSQFPVVQKGTQKYEQISIHVLTMDLQDEEDTLDLLDSEGTLLLQSPRSQWYAQVLDDPQIAEYPWADLRHNLIYDRHFTVNLIEVLEPAIEEGVAIGISIIPPVVGYTSGYNFGYLAGY